MTFVNGKNVHNISAYGKMTAPLHLIHPFISQFYQLPHQYFSFDNFAHMNGHQILKDTGRTDNFLRCFHDCRDHCCPVPVQKTCKPLHAVTKPFCS